MESILRQSLRKLAKGWVVLALIVGASLRGAQAIRRFTQYCTDGETQATKAFDSVVLLPN